MIKPLRFSALTITLSYVAVSLAVLATFALPLWYTWHETIEEGRTGILQADILRLADIFNRQGVDKLAAVIDLQAGAQPVNTENLILLTDASLKRLAGNLRRWPDGIGNVSGRFVAEIDVNGRPMRVSLITAALPNGYRLLVGSNVGKFRALEISFLTGLSAAAAIVLLLGLLGGLLIRRTLLGKVRDISQATSAIIQGDFSHRLPAISGESELNTLVDTQNRMLDQIEHLIGGIRSVSDAIAHDLRTPLAELRSRLEEVFVTRPGAEKTYNEIEGAIGDVDRVISIFNALLRLAEIDAGTRRSGFVEVDIGAIAGEVAELYQALAESEECTLSFTSSGTLTMSGDPLLLAQAIANLIDNALKYARKNGSIKVDTFVDAGGRIQIAVSDDGPGIPDADKIKVLERFYRGDTSRGTPGVGLGLSLVSAVARLHGGQLSLADNHPGLVATLILAQIP
ncbi:HAMP domain-containing protein [Oxalobacteraceae bacterium CAVE-383]|nr:HAMP domain-containing protein [Oxalobacteraceae bacterium CAVE-383]